MAMRRLRRPMDGMFQGAADEKQLHDCLVVDTNAIILNVHVERMAKELYTVPEVLREIRDKQTRRGVLATLVLPQVHLRQPSPEAMEVVIDMAKETGDYSFLSTPDLKLIALTLTLFNERNPEATVPLEDVEIGEGFGECDDQEEEKKEDEKKEAGGEEKTKKEEEKDKKEEEAPAATAESDKDKQEPEVPEPKEKEEKEDAAKTEEKGEEKKGEFCGVPAVDPKDLQPKGAWASGANFAAVLAPPSAEQQRNMRHAPADPNAQKSERVQRAIRNKEQREAFKRRAAAELEKRIQMKREREERAELARQAALAAAAAAEEEEEERMLSKEEQRKKTEAEEEMAAAAAWDGGEGEDGAGEWISPENLYSMRSKLGFHDVLDSEPVSVGCVTGDYAMQNVLLRLALDVVGPAGMHVRGTRSWVLKCYSCFEIVKDTTKRFCPKCGNKSLDKVPVMTTHDGVVEIGAKEGEQLSTLHRNAAIKNPHGGKRNHDPAHTEDELMRRRRARRRPRRHDVASKAFIGRKPVADNGTVQPKK